MPRPTSSSPTRARSELEGSSKPCARVAITQFQPVPGIIDLAWGHPDPDLLPIRELRTAAERAMDRYGPDLLAYGNAAGPPPLIDFICDRLRLTDQRRAQLLAIAAREELLIVEDDTYRELSYDGPAPASLWALDASESVIRLGSFAKSVAPGLRVGYVTASAAIAARMADGGLLDSGGGISHFAATVLAEYAAAGDYARQVERFRAAYRERRDRLLQSLADHLPKSVSWSTPAGGY